MLALLKLTQILPVFLIGMILVGAVVGESAIWAPGLILLILDAVVGIALQMLCDRAAQKQGENLEESLKILESMLDENKNDDFKETSSRKDEPVRKEREKRSSNPLDAIGENMTKESFFETQAIFPGFCVDFSYNEEQYRQLLRREKDGAFLTTDEKAKLIFPLIFGNFGVSPDLDEALSEIMRLFGNDQNAESPKRGSSEEDLVLHEFAVLNALIGTVYAYKEEPVVAAYHFMWALKTEMIELSLPWCDFIKCVLRELPPLVTEEYVGDGCGFSADDPMGSVGGTVLNARNALRLISDMVGMHKEIVVAKLGRTGMFGHCVRLGSTDSPATNNMIDIYETYVIERNYKIKKVKLYVNGYYPRSLSYTVKCPDGFRYFTLARQQGEEGKA